MVRRLVRRRNRRLCVRGRRRHVSTTSRTDWRPVVSYSTNLDRIGDWLLDTDAAWVAIGKAIERPRAASGPMANIHAGGRLPGELTGPANDRMLADHMVWQFPWYWSAGARRPVGAFRGRAVVPREVAGPAQMTPIIEFDGVSKWYGNVIGLNKLTLRIPAGVTGLLGPNGAGKSTLLQLATGQLRPSQGTVRVLGQPVWNNPALNRLIGLCPEQDAFYEWMTGLDFVRTCARLIGDEPASGRVGGRRGHGPRRHDRTHEPGHPRLLEGHAAADQAGPGAGARPRVLFLDEPLTGTDPVARRDMIDVIRGLGGRRAAACSSPATCCTRCRR